MEAYVLLFAPDVVPSTPNPIDADMTALVNARKLRSVLALGQPLGLDPAAWCARHGVDPSVLSGPDGCVPQALWGRAWRDLVAVCGSEAVGLDAAASIPRGYYGVIDYVVRTQPTLGEGMRAAVRFFPLANTGGRIEVREEDDLCVVSRHIRGDEDGSLPLQAAEFALVSMVRTFRLAASAPFQLVAIRLRHGRTAHAERTEQWFGCPVHYGAAVDAIVVDDALLRTPTVGVDAELSAIVTGHAEAALAALVAPDDFERRLRRFVQEDLEGGPEGLAAVARRMGMSSRTLQRRLTDRGTRFTAVQQHVQAELARRCLAESDLSIGEIAWLTGFTDASSFSRAYRRWFGTPPSAARG